MLNSKYDERPFRSRRRNAITGVTLLLDASGSMNVRRDETIREVNRYLEKLKSDGQRYKLTVVIFNDGISKLIVREDIRDVGDLERAEYRPEGWTRLLDAVGATLESGSFFKFDRNLFVVVTDGQENRSSTYSLNEVRDMIDRMRSEDFQFIFLGSGPDSWSTGQRLGFNLSVSADYTNPFNTENIYKGLYAATSNYSEGGTISANMLDSTSTQAKVTNE
jgi:Mg-chelatase subunit ChlD